MDSVTIRTLRLNPKYQTVSEKSLQEEAPWETPRVLRSLQNCGLLGETRETSGVPDKKSKKFILTFLPADCMNESLDAAPAFYLYVDYKLKKGGVYAIYHNQTIAGILSNQL